MQKLYRIMVVVIAFLLIVTGIVAGCQSNAARLSQETSKMKANLKSESGQHGLNGTVEKRSRENAQTKETDKNVEKATFASADGEKLPIKQKADNLQYYVFVKKSAFTVYLMDEKDNVIRTYDCTLGKNLGQKEKRGDMKTPTGTFYVDEIDDARWWTHDFGDGKGEIKGAYGPWFISLNTDAQSGGAWGGIGIHGTHKPEAMGTRDSEGCIRLRNENVEELKQYVRVGTKVVIEE